MDHFEVVNSTKADIDQIFEIYRAAVTYQKPRFENHWPEFSYEMVLIEISECRQFKLLINGHLACIWCVAFSDPEIWGDLDRDDAVYLHRIATHNDFRGLRLIERVVSWARSYAKKGGRSFIRMDTVGENKKLISHYQRSGFKYLGPKQLTNTSNLPDHYHKAIVSLFEIRLT